MAAFVVVFVTQAAVATPSLASWLADEVGLEAQLGNGGRITLAQVQAIWYEKGLYGPITVVEYLPASLTMGVAAPFSTQWM